MRTINFFASITVVFFILLITAGCTKESEKAIDFGQFEGNTYSNRFFDLEISIPESWHVMDDEARINLMQQGKKLVAGDNKNLNALLDASDLQNLNLLTASENPPGTPVPANPSIIILAENLKNAPGIKRGNDYHFHTKSMMKNTKLAVTFPKENYEKIISGKTFDVMESIINFGNLKQFQHQYVMVTKQYALLIVLTYQDGESLKKLENILQTIKFG